MRAKMLPAARLAARGGLPGHALSGNPNNGRVILANLL